MALAGGGLECARVLNALNLRHGMSMWPAHSVMAADTADPVMDGARTSPETTDSRKRPLDYDLENGHSKRSHYISGGDGGGGMYHLKVLVPGAAAGAIIGKGGETIAQLQKDTGARMKMSKSNDFYPGTSERVCLITGSVEAIMAVLGFVMEKIKEKPDLVPKPIPIIDAENKGVTDRSRQVKLLIPNTTAGMIIGKGGNYIKQIKEESGSYIQLSQKADAAVSLQERCVTIIGEMENNKKASLMVLAKVVEDPQSGNCPNISYADVTGPVANFNPTGSPYAVSPTSFGSTTSLSSTAAVSPFVMNGMNLSLNLSSPTAAASHGLSAHVLENIKLVLRSSGYSDQASAEIVNAMATLARYGILGMGMGMGLGLASYLPVETNGFGAIAPPSATSPLNNNTTHFTLSPHAALSPGQLDNEKHVEISENIVGAILGPGGRALVEIQHLSGANIQISKKGIFAPGTRNRIVTMTGPVTAIATAQFLIEQKIAEEENKRARQTTLSLAL